MQPVAPSNNSRHNEKNHNGGRKVPSKHDQGTKNGDKTNTNSRINKKKVLLLNLDNRRIRRQSRILLGNERFQNQILRGDKQRVYIFYRDQPLFIKLQVSMGTILFKLVNQAKRILLLLRIPLQLSKIQN